MVAVCGGTTATKITKTTKTTKVTKDYVGCGTLPTFSSLLFYSL